MTLIPALVAFTGSGGHPAKAGGGGNVQVTAQGSTEAHCVVVSWNPGSPNAYAVVECLSNSGQLVASKFTVQWVTR